MIRLLRCLFLPTAAFFIIGGLAWSEWAELIQYKRASEEFQKNSDIRLLKLAGLGGGTGREFPIYQYELDGQLYESPTYERLDLPVDGRARIGPAPRMLMESSDSDTPQRTLVVPLNGPDSTETVYKNFRGRDLGEDLTKASLVSLAAVISGIAGYFLQRIIFKEVGRSFRRR